MKKALSLFLAVLMIFSCLAVGASAVVQDPTGWFGEAGSGKPATYDQTILTFNTNGGKLRNAVIVYDVETGNKTRVENFSGVWAMIPAAEGTASQTPGTKVELPFCEPGDATLAFVGWELTSGDLDNLGNVYAGQTAYTIPAGTEGKVIQFTARFTTAVVEEDTLTKVLGVLTKVFGAIIGVLLYKGNTEAGVALVEKMLAGILG